MNEKNNKNQDQEASSKTIEKVTDFGIIKINERVIMSIVKKAALKVEGVSSLPSGSFVDCLTSMVTNAKTQDKSVKLDIKADTVKVSLKINVTYGKNIHELALKVQNTISEEVKSLTGMNVSKVDLEIQEMDSPDPN